MNTPRFGSYFYFKHNNPQSSKKAAEGLAEALTELGIKNEVKQRKDYNGPMGLRARMLANPNDYMVLTGKNLSTPEKLTSTQKADQKAAAIAFLIDSMLSALDNDKELGKETFRDILNVLRLKTNVNLSPLSLLFSVKQAEKEEAAQAPDESAKAAETPAETQDETAATEGSPTEAQPQESVTEEPAAKGPEAPSEEPGSQENPET